MKVFPVKQSFVCLICRPQSQNLRVEVLPYTITSHILLSSLILLDPALKTQHDF